MLFTSVECAFSRSRGGQYEKYTMLHRTFDILIQYIFLIVYEKHSYTNHRKIHCCHKVVLLSDAIRAALKKHQLSKSACSSEEHFAMI